MASTERSLSILLLVRSLDSGGAERQLVELARGLHRKGHAVTVATFYQRGPLIAEVARAGIPLVDLKKGGRWDVVRFIRRARQALRSTETEVIYSFLGGANIVAALMRIGMPRVQLVWSIRSSDVDLSRYDWLHRASYRVERLLSGLPDLIIANSYSGRDHAAANGFPRERIEVVPNGIDTDRFRPVAALRCKQRAQWGLADEEIAVGVLARLDPMKGHRDFLDAAALLGERHPELRFFVIGAGPEEDHLKRLAANLCLAGKVAFTGAVYDPVAALNALDICCSPSAFGEGFSNSVAEAMACAVPCVVTDVGDSGLIVGQTGIVVSRSDPDALGRGVVDLAERLDDGRKQKARRRVVDHYSVEAMVKQTIAAFALAGRSK